MTAETLRDNLLAVRPNTEILVRDHKGRDSLLYSIEVSAGGTEPDSVVLHLSPYPMPWPGSAEGRMITRDEHLKWAKKRALEYVEMGDLLQALTSIGSDLTKHPETQNHPGFDIGMQLYMIGSLHTAPEMRHFIEGFR